MRTVKEFFSSMYSLPPGLYEPVSSLVHGIGSGAKLLCFMLIVIAVIVAKNLFGFLILTIIIGAIIYLSELPLGRVFADLCRLTWLLVIVSLLAMCLYHRSGEPWTQIWLLDPTTEGVLIGLLAGLRTAYILVALNMLNATASPTELYFGAKELLSPLMYLKLRTEAAAAFLAAVLQFLPIYFEELERIRTAKITGSSGWRERGPGRWLASFTSVFPALRGGVQRTVKLKKALFMRGTESQTKPRLKNLRPRLNDVSAVLVCLALLGLETVVF